MNTKYDKYETVMGFYIMYCSGLVSRTTGTDPDNMEIINSFHFCFSIDQYYGITIGDVSEFPLILKYLEEVSYDDIPYGGVNILTWIASFRNHNTGDTLGLFNLFEKYICPIRNIKLKNPMEMLDKFKQEQLDFIFPRISDFEEVKRQLIIKEIIHE